MRRQRSILQRDLEGLFEGDRSEVMDIRMVIEQNEREDGLGLHGHGDPEGLHDAIMPTIVQ